MSGYPHLDEQREEQPSLGVPEAVEPVKPFKEPEQSGQTAAIVPQAAVMEAQQPAPGTDSETWTHPDWAEALVDINSLPLLTLPEWSKMVFSDSLESDVIDQDLEMG